MAERGSKLRALTRRFAGDRRAVASIFGAMAMLTGFGMAVMVLDVGHLYLEKRRLQSAVDAAALAAAGDPANASTIVAHVLADRGYAQSASIATGAYSADSSLSPDDRFDADPSAQQNAVRVRETIATPSILARLISGAPQSNVTASATAAQIPVVSFSAGTGLATLSGGEINAVLGGLLGTGLTLSLANYQALAATNVDALTFLDQLAAQAGVSAGTYGDLAATSVTMSALATAITAALNLHPDGNDSAAIDALNLLSLQTPAGASAQVGQIAGMAVWQKRQIGSIAEQTPGQVAFNLYDLIAAMARAYGAGHLVSLGSTLSVPVAGVTLSTSMAVGSPMTSVAAATVGTGIATDQIRIAVTATASGFSVLGLSLASFTLPFYLQIASGTATVAAIPCQSGGTMATISAASQAATVSLGGVSAGDFTNFGVDPTPAPATISLLGVTLSASGTFPVAAGPAQDLDFTQSDIDSGAIKEVAGSDAGAIFSNFGGSGQATVSITAGGLSLNAGPLKALIQTLLANILSGLDGPTDLLLRTLGLRLGVMDVAVHGVRCGTPTLVT